MIANRSLRRAAALTALVVLAGALSCQDSDERRAEQALLAADSEEGGMQGLLSLDYEITSQVFKKWKRAQLSLDRALGRSQSRSLKTAIVGTSPTREAIERSVARIESNARARRAIGEAGMSPRHYVVATVALFQATRGIDPITGEAFRGVPARNVEFARRNQAELQEADEGGEFQAIADSVAAARAAGRDSLGVIQTEVVIDTVRRLPRTDTGRTPPPSPTPPPQPRPTPTPPPPDTTPEDEGGGPSSDDSAGGGSPSESGSEVDN